VNTDSQQRRQWEECNVPAFVRFRQMAEACARLRDSARSPLGRERLDREHRDWLRLASEAGLDERAASTQLRLSDFKSARRLSACA